MKIIAEKSALQAGVNTVLKAVPSKTTMPILECILIDTTDGVIKLTATDTDLGIQTIVDGDILDKGMIALEAKLFSEIVRRLPDSQVTIETDAANRARITCEKAKFHIAGKSGEDFASLPEVPRDKYIELTQFSLKEVIRQTIFCTSDSETNKLMSGEYFEISGNTMKITALDGQRISIRKVELRDVYDDMKAIIPGKTLSEVSKILPGDADSFVMIYFTDKHILFEFDKTTVVSRVIDGEYFQVNRMISSDYNTKITINKKELQSCVERASLLIKESDRKPIIINILDGVLAMKIQSPIGSMDEDIEIKKEGKDIMIGFNPRYLLDALRAIDGDDITMYFINRKAPFIIRDDEQSYVYLILPISFNI